MKEYTIPEFGIVVQVRHGSAPGLAGRIRSRLKEHLVSPDSRDEDELTIAVDTIESLLLAHAVAGIDISSPAYVQGLRECLEAVANHY
jgi:hypothetical protein